jgi:DNA invertase Pin-like site-specific DNA recombinase
MAVQKRAWIYTRIDAPEDAHDMLKKQEKELMDYAERLGFAVVGGSSDLGGGTDADMPGLARVGAAAKEGEFDVLLIKSPARLGRNTDQTVSFLNELERHGIEVYSPLEGKIDAAMPAGILSHGNSETRGHRHA